MKAAVAMVACLPLVACTIDTLHHAPGLRGHGSEAGKADGDSTVWWIGAATDPAIEPPNAGVRTTFHVADTPPAHGCIDWWTSATLANGMWGQVGAQSCTIDGPSLAAFYQVWKDGVELVEGVAPVTEGLHSFAMAATDATTWSFTVDGQELGSLDMGAATSTGDAGTLVEEGNGVPAPYAPPSVAFPEALSVLQGGVWMTPKRAVVYNTAGVGAVVSPHVNDITIGGGPAVAADTELWRASQVPSAAPVTSTTAMPDVTFAAPIASTTVSHRVVLRANARGADEITEVWFAIDSGATLCNLTAPPYECTWDTSGTPAGSHYITVGAQDASGRTEYVSETIHVAP